ncbi:MAG: hypothetical protein ABF743_10145 [Schleiferilactobacillus perolens]|uniref:hypothetical protein n=1 Tax=Schleiferilactobacillus perolens TaxID=100468 RepID=UPI0039EAEF56
MDEFYQAMSDLFDWTDGKNPKQHLPEFVHERINWVIPYVDEGLTYFGALRAVLGYNEPELQQEFELGGE